jgi:hypothetical protein
MTVTTHMSGDSACCLASTYLFPILPTMSQRKGSGYASIPADSDVEQQQAEAGSTPADQSSWKQFLNSPKVREARNALGRNPAGTFTAALGLAVCGLVILALFLPDGTNLSPFPSHKGKSVVAPGISASAFEEGLQKCRQLKAIRAESYSDVKRKNPRAVNGTPDVLLKNAVVWDGEGNILQNVNVLLQDGVVKAVGKDVEATGANTEVIDVKGHIVSPGLVDMHRSVFKQARKLELTNKIELTRIYAS